MTLFDPFAQGRDFATHAAALTSVYRDADPFPHIVLDGFFRPDFLRSVLAEVPAPATEAELNRTSQPGLQERKHEWQAPEDFGAAADRLVNSLNSRPFLEFLSTVSGIQGLIADPYLRGGGFHQIGRGGKLAVHADFNMHKIMHVYRRINLLLYLNPGWQEDWGGALELWPPDMSACKARIPPLFNRMVIFSTTDTSYHGHPEPLGCPDGVLRRSLALYYYTAEKLSDAVHSTLWQDRPQDAGAVAEASAAMDAQRAIEKEQRRLAHQAAADEAEKVAP